MSELYNFADNDAILTASKNMDSLIHILEKEWETAVEWFSQNKMIVNPDKVQAMLLEKRNENNQSFLKINTAQKMKFSITDLFSKCDLIRRILRIWSHLLKESLMGNFIFCAVQ